MTYEEAKHQLDQYTTLGSVYGLESIERLVTALGRPERKLRIIHVAGTNGKGSTVTALASVLEAAGYTTATYTSPEVTTYLDRFRVRQKPVSEDAFVKAYEMVSSAAQAIEETGFPHPTIFEMEVALAYVIAYQAGVEILIQETGLGGRMDATNIVESPILVILTAIGLDHMALLGDTVEAIAAEKAGIIKKGTSVVAYDNGSSINQVIAARAKELDCPCYFSEPSALRFANRDMTGQSWYYKETCYYYPLIGVHQQKNLALILKSIEVLQGLGYTLSTKAIQKGLAELRWPGRFELIDMMPPVILDGAHNPQAAQSLAETVKVWFPNRPVHLLVHLFKDKDGQGILKALVPIAHRMTLTTIENERSEKTSTLAKWVDSLAPQCPYHIDNDFSHALSSALDAVPQDGLLLICGSLSHLEKARQLLLEMKGRNFHG